MILIKGGRLIDPGSGTDAVMDVVLDGDRVIYTGPGKTQGNDSTVYDAVIDARGKIVAPGLIDVHVHLREPGFTYKEDIESGSRAAAAGGFTTVVAMANTRPAMDNPETLAEFTEKARLADINVYTVAAVSKGLRGEELVDMAALKAMGARGFSDDGLPVLSSGLLLLAMRKAGELGVPISLHEEDPALIAGAGINTGKAAAGLGLAGAPSVAETSLIARDLALAGELAAAGADGVRLHIQHLSSADSVEMIRRAKADGIPVTAELTPHHFSLTEDALITHGALAKVNPPLRTEDDRQALIKGLADSTIDIIASDHAPHSAGEKFRPFTEAPSGMIGLETALALGITMLVKPGHISLMSLMEKMSLAPANLYGFDGGYLAEGGPADVTIFDEQEEWAVSSFASKSANSPFIGQRLYGKVSYTICKGRVVYQNGEHKC